MESFVLTHLKIIKIKKTVDKNHTLKTYSPSNFLATGKRICDETFAMSSVWMCILEDVIIYIVVTSSAIHYGERYPSTISENSLRRDIEIFKLFTIFFLWHLFQSPLQCFLELKPYHTANAVHFSINCRYIPTYIRVGKRSWF